MVDTLSFTVQKKNITQMAYIAIQIELIIYQLIETIF